MWLKINYRNIVAAMCLCVASSTFAGAYENAMQQIKRGEYKQGIKALEKLDKQGDARAQFSLARQYLVGKSVKRDYRRALKGFKKAGNRGHVKSMLYAGLIHYKGLLGTREFVQAKAWFEKGALKGDPAAISFLGDLYRLGQGVPRNFPKAINLYKKSAANGYAHAQYMLGAMYGSGIGVDKNRKISLKYYRMAAASGHSRARRFLASYKLAQRFKVSGVAKSKLYGYSPKQPINTGFGPGGQRAYLSRLRGPNGEPVSYRRIGSCCPFKSPGAPFGQALMDRYQVSYKGLQSPVILYLNMYNKGKLWIPKGFTYQ